MPSRDPAFLWETEVLRTSGSRGTTKRRVDSTDWLTVREASEATGIPISTIRKWARNENIPSYLQRSDEGELRMVSMGGIKRRADELEREIDADPPTESRDRSGHAGQDTDLPDGTMLVPLDAWNRMLNQLGNLHEAGQQLAEAKERAARAETEAAFLKERLAELRAQVASDAETTTDGGPGQPARDRPEGRPKPATLVSSLYRGWRARRRNRR